MLPVNSVAIEVDVRIPLAMLRVRLVVVVVVAVVVYVTARMIHPIVGGRELFLAALMKPAVAALAGCLLLPLVHDSRHRRLAESPELAVVMATEW